MSSRALRGEVIKVFKKLHRESSLVFRNNIIFLEAAKEEINNAFKKNKHITDQKTIEELILHANNVCKELRITVAEVEQINPEVYRLKLRPDMFQESETSNKR